MAKWRLPRCAAQQNVIANLDRLPGWKTQSGGELDCGRSLASGKGVDLIQVAQRRIDPGDAGPEIDRTLVQFQPFTPDPVSAIRLRPHQFGEAADLFGRQKDVVIDSNVEVEG